MPGRLTVLTLATGPVPLHRPLWIAALSVACAWSPAAAQAPDRARSGDDPAPALVLPGSDADDRARLRQIRGEAPTAGYLIRSAATQGEPGDGGFRWVWPRVASAWNSDIPLSLNDNATWAGRGWSMHVLGGAAFSWGHLSLLLAPEFVYARNLPFDSLTRYAVPEGEFRPYWQTGRHSLDLPLRHGGGPIARLGLGQSTLEVELGAVTAGASSANQWWGPGLRNAIVLSNNAPGIPHVFARTTRPVRTPVGAFEAKLFSGTLRESWYFDANPRNDLRSLNALAVTYQPAWEPTLTLGIARAVYAPVNEVSDVLPHMADVFFHWASPDSTTAGTAVDHDQILSLFGRWIAPEVGAEVYGEWARHLLPTSLGNFLRYPHYTQGYTIGLQWTRSARSGDLFRIQGEVTNLEKSAAYREGRYPPYYVGRAAAQGYTHHGQVVGAGIGPGASSQWLATDYLFEDWRVGLYGGRIRWATDAFYDEPVGIPNYFSHDVSILGGIRGGGLLRHVQVELEVGIERRLNYLFQNFAVSWERSDSTVDVTNVSFRLVVSPQASARDSGPGPVAVPSPPDAVLARPDASPEEEQDPAPGPEAPPSPDDPSAPPVAAPVEGAPPAPPGGV